MRAAVLLLLLALAGCASDIPRPIREAPPGDLRPAQALAEAETRQGTAVRWGGAVASVENRSDETWLEIVEHPLYSDGRPRRTDRSDGRFLARVPGFLDPALYARQRFVTVAGTLEEPVTRTIGAYPYRYPVVRATGHYLWPREPDVVHHHYYYYPPYWYEPWYYPWRLPPPTRR
jgi:outer membrane lipoprotein